MVMTTPSHGALKKLHSKSASQVSVIPTADGCLVSAVDGQLARQGEYFEHLFKVNPPSGHLQTTGLQVMDADPPINQAASSFDEVKETVTKLRGGKAAGICNMSVELLKD